MRRWLTVVSCVWAALFTVLYVALVERPENGGIAWPLVIMIAVGSIAAATALAVAPAPARVLLLVATALFCTGVIAGLLSVGLLLLPAAALTALAAWAPAPTTAPGPKATV